jgi:hypothetical protein
VFIINQVEDKTMNGRNPDSGFWQAIVLTAALLLCLATLPGHAADQYSPVDTAMPSLDLRDIMANW